MLRNFKNHKRKPKNHNFNIKLNAYKNLASYHNDRKLVAISTDPDAQRPPDREPGEPVPIFSLSTSKYHKNKILACDEIGQVWFFVNENFEPEGSGFIYEKTGGTEDEQQVQVKEKGLHILHHFNGHDKSPIHEIEFIGQNHTKFITIGSDAQINLWDLQGQDSIFNFKAGSDLVADVTYSHDKLSSTSRIKAVKSIDFSSNNYSGCHRFDFVTGCSNNFVKFWDVRTPANSVRSIQVKTTKCKGSGNGITALEFHPLNYNLYIGQSGYNEITVLDWRFLKHFNDSKTTSNKKCDTILNSIKYPGQSKRIVGYNSIIFDKVRHRLIAGCTDDRIYGIKLLSNGDHYNDVVFCGHSNRDYYNKICLNDDFMLSGSGATASVSSSSSSTSSTNKDLNAYMWDLNIGNKPDIKEPQLAYPILTFENGHDREVRCVKFLDRDWSDNYLDNNSVVTASDDGSVRFWRPFDKDIKHLNCRVKANDGVTKSVLGLPKSASKQIPEQNININTCKTQDIDELTQLLKDLPSRLQEQDKFKINATPMKKRQYNRNIKSHTPRTLVGYFSSSKMNKKDNIKAQITPKRVSNRKKRKNKDRELALSPKINTFFKPKAKLSVEDDEDDDQYPSRNNKKSTLPRSLFGKSIPDQIGCSSEEEDSCIKVPFSKKSKIG